MICERVKPFGGTMKCQYPESQPKPCKWKQLYEEINKLMAELGARGEIGPDDAINVMRVLHEIDGGGYKPNLTTAEIADVSYGTKIHHQ